MIHDVGNTSPSTALLQAIQNLRRNDPEQALTIVDAAIEDADDRKPYLALGGMAALSCGKPEQAIQRFRELAQLAPDDPANSANLAHALIQVGEFEEALAVVQSLASPQNLRTEAFILQQVGRLEEAAEAYREILVSGHGDPAVLNNLGNVLTALGLVDQAIPIFEQAITFEPEDVKFYLNLSETLRVADRPVPRVKVMQDAARLAPRDVQVLTELGLAYLHNEQLEPAEDAFRRAIEECDTFCDAHIEYALLLEGLNRTDDLNTLAQELESTEMPAAGNYVLALQARRDGKFEQAAEFAANIPETILASRRWQLIASVADRLGHIDLAFDGFEKMNAAALIETPRPAGPSYRKVVEGELQTWTDEWAKSMAPFRFDDGFKDPVFLVGFPRSGTTLLDTMLMGSNTLSVLEERPMVAYLTSKLGSEDLSKIDENKAARLREAYFRAAQMEGWPKSRRLVDKHPLHMQRVPMLKRLFPNAQFILAERHPYDAVLSCFMTNFRLNKAMRSFAHLDEAALTYDAVWRSWERALKLFDIAWMPVRYERLISNAEEELRPLIDWLDADWNPRILDHRALAQKRGRVKTASYSQIQESLYTRAKDRWRLYSAHLESVKPILSYWAEPRGYATN